MASSVFTGADIAFNATNAIDAPWVTAAATWSGTNDVNGDSGTVSNAGGASPGMSARGTLVDDSSIPTSVRVISVQIEFDWHIVNVGGTCAGCARPDSTIGNTGGIPATVTQLSDSDTTGHYDYTYQNAFVYFSGTANRAALFAATYGFGFNGPVRTGANTSRVVVSNFTVTVVYINTGAGSWLIRTAAMTNATGSVDFTTFAPDIAEIENPSQSGTIDVPIDDVAGDYVYVDGGGSPVSIAGLPSGFTPDSEFFVHFLPGVQFSGDTVGVVLAPLINVTVDLTNAATIDFPETGMTVANMSALLSATMVSTLTTGADPTVVLLRCYLESDSSSGWSADFSAGLWGTYTIVAPPEVTRVSPSSGSVSGGQAVTITGMGFTAATGVEFGGTAATSVVIVSDTSITAVTPAHLSGVVDVEVLSVATGTALYTYTVETIRLPPMPVRTPMTQGGGKRGR